MGDNPTMISSPAELRNRLKLRQLTLLASLSASGSLHKAAERCGMSQPAATRLLQELEELIGVQLFERTSRGMAPTDMGRLLIRHASMVLAGIDHVYHEAAALRSGNAGSVRLGVSPGASPQLVARAVSKVKRGTPRMDIEIVDGANEFLVAGLRDGNINLAVGRAPAASTTNIAFEVLFTEHFSVVCGTSHKVVEQDISLAGFIDQPWILPLPATALRASLDLHFLSQCGRLPHDVIESVSIPINVALIEQAGRFAVMPRSLAREHHDRGRLQILLETLPDLTGPIGILTRRGEEQASHVLRLMESLRIASREFTEADARGPELRPIAPRSDGA
jgi:DNA-binding transcriptional LysR family regulator